MLSNDPSWVERSQLVTQLTAEIAFPLRDQTNRDPAHSQPISLPPFPRKARLRATTREILGHESQLAEHYRRVLTASTGETYLWLSLMFHSEDAQVSIPFPWWDGLSDMRGLLTWLRHPTRSPDFFDCDQGWAFQAIVREQTLHLLHYDLETNELLANIAGPHAGLLESFELAFSNASSIAETVGSGLGLEFPHAFHGWH